jgi:hypothetical protein
MDIESDQEVEQSNPDAKYSEAALSVGKKKQIFKKEKAKSIKAKILELKMQSKKLKKKKLD